MTKPIELNEVQIHRWMKRLITRAENLGKTGEVPVTAIVLDAQGRCIGHGSNQRNRTKNPLGHAELIALRQAAWLKKDWRFNDCTLIVTLEPCPMCAGALTQARMGQVIFGAIDKKRGGLGGTIDLANHASSHHYMKVVKGVMKKDAGQQLETWFKQKLRKNSENQVIPSQKD